MYSFGEVGGEEFPLYFSHSGCIILFHAREVSEEETQRVWSWIPEVETVFRAKASKDQLGSGDKISRDLQSVQRC